MTHFMIPNFHWHPKADPEILEPWFPLLNTLKRNPLKSNGTRFVFRVISTSGTCYYVKLEEKRGLIPMLRNLFSPKVRSEYDSGKLLESLGIPCIQYAAWGTSGSSGILISLEKAGYVPLPELWFSRLLMNPEKYTRVIREMAELAARFASCGLHHPDFHMGNILIDPCTLELCVADPYGIALKKSDPSELLPCLLEMRGRLITGELLIAELERAGFPDAAANFSRAEAWLTGLVNRQWPRRQQQITSRQSKFALSPIPGKWIRNSAWYSPLELPPTMEEETMPVNQAEKIWLESFKDQLLRKKRDSVPIIFEKKGEKATLFSIKDDFFKTFYGF